MKYNLVIFDLDGTLLNTLDDIADSCNSVLKAHNLPARTREEVRMAVGNGIPKLIERSVPEGTPADVTARVLNDFIADYTRNSRNKTAPYDGIPELLKDLKDAGVKIAVNTNKREETSIEICREYFPNLIDALAGGRSDVPHKPDPAGVERILNELGADRSRTVYVGDSDVDFQTAVNAGLDVVCVDWGFRSTEFLKAHGCTPIASTAAELRSAYLRRP